MELITCILIAGTCYLCSKYERNVTTCSKCGETFSAKNRTCWALKLSIAGVLLFFYEYLYLDNEVGMLGAFLLVLGAWMPFSKKENHECSEKERQCITN